MDQYLIKMAEILEVDSVTVDDEFDTFDVWDSLTILSIIVLISDDCKISLTQKQITEAKTVGNLHKLYLSKFYV